MLKTTEGAPSEFGCYAPHQKARQESSGNDLVCRCLRGCALPKSLDQSEGCAICFWIWSTKFLREVTHLNIVFVGACVSCFGKCRCDVVAERDSVTHLVLDRHHSPVLFGTPSCERICILYQP